MSNPWDKEVFGAYPNASWAFFMDKNPHFGLLFSFFAKTGFTAYPLILYKFNSSDTGTPWPLDKLNTSFIALSENSAAIMPSAQENWRKTFSDRSFPDNAPEINTDVPELSTMAILKLGMPDTSNSELRRLIIQKAVTINDTKAASLNQMFQTDKKLFVRVGRKTFFKVLAN